MYRCLLFGFLLGLLPLASHAQRPATTHPTTRRPVPGEEPTPAPVYQGEAFLGTWEWRSGSEIFRMTLRRDRFYSLPNGDRIHVILGQHSFTRNGVILEDSYHPNVHARRGWSLLGRPHEDWSISMGFLDLSKDKSGEASLSIDPDSPDNLHFELRGVEGAYIVTPNSPPPPSPGFTIPTSMTLTRVP